MKEYSNYPRAVNVTYRPAPKARRQRAENLALSWEGVEA
jgi:hypothetical protein